MKTPESDALEQIEILAQRLHNEKLENQKLKQLLADYRCGRIYSAEKIEVEPLKAELKYLKTVAAEQKKELSAWRSGALKHDRA